MKYSVAVKSLFSFREKRIGGNEGRWGPCMNQLVEKLLHLVSPAPHFHFLSPHIPKAFGPQESAQRLSTEKSKFHDSWGWERGGWNVFLATHNI